MNPGVIAVTAVQLATRAVKALEGIDRSLRVLSGRQGESPAAWSGRRET